MQVETHCIIFNKLTNLKKNLAATESSMKRDILDKVTKSLEKKNGDYGEIVQGASPYPVQKQPGDTTNFRPSRRIFQGSSNNLQKAKAVQEIKKN